MKKRSTKTAIMIVSLLALAVLVVGPLARESHAACPIGSYPWVDNWGTSVCKSFGGGAEYGHAGKFERLPRWLSSVGGQMGDEDLGELQWGHALP